jgi:hypothetical protein
LTRKRLWRRAREDEAQLDREPAIRASVETGIDPEKVRWCVDGIRRPPVRPRLH